MVITFLFFPFITDDPPIQSVSFTSSENKCVKQRRINTVDFIVVVMAGGFKGGDLTFFSDMTRKRQH